MPAARRRSLAFRLTLWYALSSFALVLLVIGYLYWALAGQLEQENDRSLAERCVPLVNLLRERPVDVAAIQQNVELVRPTRQDPTIYFRVLDQRQQQIADTPGMGLVFDRAKFPEPEPFERNALHGWWFRSPVEEPYRLAAVSVTAQDGTYHIVQAALDCSHGESLLAEYRRHLHVVVGVALVVCSLGGYFLARRGIRPVAAIAAAANHIGSTNLNERIADENWPTELHTLAATFNAMMDRLEVSFARLAQFAADIAHELRTPINNLRGEAEVALGKARTPTEYQELLASALEEYDRLTRLIESLLFLARAENPAHQLQRDAVDVGQELERLRDFYEATAAETGVTLSVVGSEERIVAFLDRTLFQRAIANLVANALRHTPTGGSVTISARSEEDRLSVEVADTGGGIAAEHLPRVFDRFYRVERVSQGNVGLGLAIVKSIAELHGGTIAIQSEVGKGTVATLTMPWQKAR